MRSTAPFAVSAALSRARGRWLRAPVCRARRFGYSNDAAGRRTAISRSGEAFGDLSGAVDAYGYNLRSEVVSARRTKGGASVRGFDEDFSYDPIGNHVATTNYDETGSAIVSEYTANSLNQYTSRTVPGVAAARGFALTNATVTVNESPTWRLGEYFYGSDEFDNSQSSVDAALVTAAALASPTNGPDEVASVTSRVHIAKSPQHFEYDDDGNQTLVTTKTGTWRVKYNGENRPVRWERLNSSTPNSNTPSLITMTFDHQGRRRSYIETSAVGTTNRLDRFTYDNYLCIARNRWQQDGTSVADRFVWDPTEPVATRPLVFYQPNAPHQLYSIDGNKNVSELVSSADGSISAHYEYAPFGEVILSSGDLALTNQFRFSSEYADDAISLVYYNFRHLDPVIGRWLQSDPMMQFANPYVFCANCGSYCFDWIGLESVPITFTYGYHDSRKIAEISYSVNRLPCPDGGVSIDRIHLTLSPNEFSSDKDFLQNLQVFFIRNLEAYDLPIPFKLLDADFEAQGEVVASWSEQSGNYVRRCIKERLWVNILERGFVFNFYIWDGATMKHKYQLGNSAFVTACGPWCCKEKK